jgi:hypothetical protein
MTDDDLDAAARGPPDDRREVDAVERGPVAGVLNVVLKSGTTSDRRPAEPKEHIGLGVSQPRTAKDEKS